MKPSFQKLLTDKHVAEVLSMSSSWVRVERHKRRHEQPHVLDIDPVMIGRSPRYRIEDVEAFVDRMIAANDIGGQGNG